MNALNVANYLLAHQLDDAGDAITNLKLQKLLYYAQGLYLAAHGAVLFPEPIEKWTHGPVVPVVFHHFEPLGNQPLQPDADFNSDSLTEAQREFLDEVYHVYGQFAAWKLRDMTQHDTPWQTTNEMEEIPQQALEQYFQEHLH